MPSSRRTKLNRVMLGIASTVLVALVSLSYGQWRRYRNANAEAERSRETLVAIDNVLTDLVNAETGQRGFLLTGEDRYLKPYYHSLQELPNDLGALNRLLSASREGKQESGELDALANEKVQQIRRTIDIRRTQGARAALAIILTNEGQRNMDSIRALCLEMRSNENAHEVRASTQGETAVEMTLLITVAGSLVLLFFFAFGLEPFASPDPQAWQRSWYLRYGAAALGVVAITLIRAALTPLMSPISMPFTLYFCAVAFAAWFGGFRPAVLSIVLSLLAGSWFFAAPTGSFLVSGHDDQTAMLMLVVVGFGIALLSRSQRSAVERALRAEVSEREERQRFETTLASIGDAVIATDAAGRITFVNRVAAGLLEWPEEEARGKPLDEVFRIVNEVTRAAVESPVARVLREGQIIGLANHTVLIGKNGTEVPIDDSAAPIRDGKGNIQGTVLVFRDVTERRRTENQLAEQASLLEKAAAQAQAQRQRLGLALTAGTMGVYEEN
ncbi:MAG TPA: CHASE3 domain-containing protein, partial [Terracidiphilus sp.]